MAVANMEDLFVYELSAMHDEERETAVLTADMVDQTRDDDLRRAIQLEHQECQRRIKNLALCFHSIGSRPRSVAAVVVDGIHAEYQRFLSLRPSDVTVDLYTFGTALKLARFGIGSYQTLVDKAVVTGKTACTQALQENLLVSTESAGRLHRINHQIDRTVMADDASGPMAQHAEHGTEDQRGRGQRGPAE